MKAVNHCHSLKIAHRDIKPENILLDENGSLKLIDFGLSKQVKKKKMTTIVGTPYYIAPEVLTGNYNVKCDIWSLGVIMYILLSGYLPFGGNGAAEVFEKVQAGEYNFSQKEWKKVSKEAMDLISKMLQVDTKKRYTAEQCLKHEWFIKAGEFKNDSDKDPLDPDMITNLLSFKGSTRLKKAAMNLLIKSINGAEFDDLREQFELLDKDSTGNVDAEELSKALRNAKFVISEEQIDAIIKEVDDANNNTINYTEFLAATVKARKYLNDNRLMMLFKEFDTDDTGYITKENLEEAFSKLEKPISSTEINKILDTHDSSKDGKISYEEFAKMLLGDDNNLVEFN